MARPLLRPRYGISSWPRHSGHLGFGGAADPIGNE
jgi:hypothetical protein